MIPHNATFGLPIYVFDPQICVFHHVSDDTALGSSQDERTIIILLLISLNKTQ